MKFLLPFLLSCVLATGASFYVSTTGNNANAGTVGSPWRNVWYAANHVAAGDTVNVGAGTFNEFVTNTVSGTPGNPITFIGASSWATIIDPSTDLSTGWVAAPEVGSGVWKNTAPFETHELTIAGKRLAFVNTTNSIAVNANIAYTTNYITTGSQLLALGTSATVKPVYNGVQIPFWDGIEAMWSASGTTTFLRLRNGSDPNSLAIRVAPNATEPLSSLTPVQSTVQMTASNIVYSGFAVRGGVGQFLLTGSGCRDNVIRSNLISNGVAGVFATTSAHRNLIQGNTFTADFYGTTNIGSWIEPGTVAAAKRENIYQISKYFMGNQGSLDDRVYLYHCGDSNTVTGNVFLPSLGLAVEAQGSVGSPFFGTTISSNLVQSQPSVGIELDEGATQVQVFDNTVLDCNISLRMHDWGMTGDSDRVAYVFRNKFWLPSSSGDHVFFHWYDSTPDTYHPVLWFYHNDLSGGRGGIEPDVENDWADLGMSKVYLVNNVFDNGRFVLSWDPFWSSSTQMGACDYNLRQICLYPNTSPAAWEQAHEIVNAGPFWPNNVIPMSWGLPANSPARDAALDLTTSFTLNGNSFSALPTDGTVKRGPSWDIGAVEMGSAFIISNLVVRALSVAP